MKLGFRFVNLFFFQVDNGGASSEKPMPAAEDSKDLKTPEPPSDPGESGPGDAQIDGDGGADDKGDAVPAADVAAPIAEGTCLAVIVFQFTVFLMILNYYLSK